jgi:ABC-2 type transport system ATP-binding protein
VPRLKERVEEMIETVGLQLEAHKKIETLSKGYRQRVGLAQALIHDPQVLILDEPTSGLDPNQLAEIRNLIVSIGKTKTVMLSTHIMQEVEAMCDRAFIINRGNIVADNLDVKELAKGNERLEDIFKRVTSGE